MTRQLLGLSGFAIAISVLLGWGKLKIWDWQDRREGRR